jgi:hypothetical protein
MIYGSTEVELYVMKKKGRISREVRTGRCPEGQVFTAGVSDEKNVSEALFP